MSCRAKRFLIVGAVVMVLPMVMGCRRGAQSHGRPVIFVGPDALTGPVAIVKDSNARRPTVIDGQPVVFEIGQDAVTRTPSVDVLADWHTVVLHSHETGGERKDRRTLYEVTALQWGVCATIANEDEIRIALRNPDAVNAECEQLRKQAVSDK